MRILIANNAPLVRELGAAQIAIGLAEGLRGLGHEVVLWSPLPVPGGKRYFGTLASKRLGFEEFASSSGTFDVVDAPAPLITSRVAALSQTVARSIQPELRYRWLEVVHSLRTRPISASTFRNLVTSLTTWHAHERGWKRASWILCLGGLETGWMRSRYPKWIERLGTYAAAPHDSDRAALRRVREERSRERPSSDPRYLWIGRWTNHKGTKLLQEWLTRRSADGVSPRLTIAGCGRDVLLDLPAGLQEAGRIEIVAEFKRADLPALLARHDAGLFTSVVEGWGLSLQEMLESGLPVFASRTGAVPDLGPWLGPLLRPFPPAAPETAGTQAEIDWGQYEDRFNWSQIAREYVEFISEGVTGVSAR